MSEPKRLYFETNGVKKSSSEPSAADTRKTIRLELNLSTAESYPQFNYLDLVAAEKVKKKCTSTKPKKNNHQNELLFVCDVDARNEEKSILRYCDGTFSPLARLHLFFFLSFASTVVCTVQYKQAVVDCLVVRGLCVAAVAATTYNRFIRLALYCVCRATTV